MLFWDLKYKLPKYLGDEKEYDEIIKALMDLTNYFLERGREGDIEKKVLSYFTQGLTYLVNAEKAFFSKDYSGALQMYEDAKRRLVLFRDSWGSREDFWDNLSRTYLFRTEGMISASKAMTTNDRLEQMKQFSEALKSFNEEVKLFTSMGDTYPAYVAFSRATFSEGMYWYKRGVTEKLKSTARAKKSLMNARGSMRKSVFFERRFISFFEEIVDQLDTLTQERVITKADELWTKSLISVDEGKYQNALKYSKLAKLLYKRAADLSSDVSKKRILLATATILDASYLEAKGNLALRELNKLDDAIEYFRKAEITADKALAMIGSFGSDQLRAGFEAEKEYYKGMTRLIKGIKLFDEQKYEEAKKYFKEALDIFSTAEKLAKLAENELILQFCHIGKNDARGYIELCNVLLL